MICIGVCWGDERLAEMTLVVDAESRLMTEVQAEVGGFELGKSLHISICG